MRRYRQVFATVNKPLSQDFVVNEFNFDYVIHPRLGCDETTDIIILINSHPANVKRRNAIRDTWGGSARSRKWAGGLVYTTYKTSILFVVGLSQNATVMTAIDAEADKHHDVMQASFLDHYHNLTLKSLFAMRYARDYCHNTKFLVKSDDDMFINLPALFHTVTDKTE